jgi:hypothetical protein
LAYVVVLTLAALILKISRNVLIQAGGLDAFIYTSYIQNYLDLAKRFGLTYYSTRVAHLYPAGLVVALFGTEPGYFVYRYLLLCTGLGAVWRLSEKHYGTPVALFAVALTACQPWLLRSLFWDHYDSSGVVYLLLATAFLGTAMPEDRVRLFLAGGFYALATSCNLFLLAVGASLFVSYVIVYVRRVSDIARFIAVSFAGFLAFYSPLCLMHYSELPRQGLFFDLLTLDFAESMVTGLGQQWHVDVVPLVKQGWAHLLVPATALSATAVLLLVHRAKRTAVLLHAALNLAFVSVLYLMLDLLFKVAVISLFYYFIYLFPATWFSIIVLVGETALAVEDRMRRMVLCIAAAVSVVAYATYPRWSPLLFWTNVRCVAVLGVLCVAAVAAPVRYARLGLIVLVLGTVASPVPFYRTPAGFYRAIHDGNPGLEWDVYRAAIELEHLVSRYPPSGGAAGFWYTNRPESLLNSVQSMFLWRYSRLAAPGDPNDGMPALPDPVRQRIPMFRYLFLLAERPEELEQGRQALDAAGVKTRILGKDSYNGQYFHMRCVVLERLSVSARGELRVCRRSGAQSILRATATNEAPSGSDFLAAIHLASNERMNERTPLTTCTMRTSRSTSSSEF